MNSLPNPKDYPRKRIDWQSIPEMRQEMALYLAEHEAWTVKADAAYLNRNYLHPMFDRDYVHYQEWLKSNPEPKAPFCAFCGHAHGNSDCYGVYA